MAPEVHPDLIELARESRGMTQGALAEATGSISQPLISKIEHGTHTPSAERLQSIAEALKYPPEFFYQSGRIGWTVCLHHRKRQSMPVTRLKMIHAQVNIARMQVMRLMRGIEIDSPLTFPRMDMAEYESPEQIARLARGHWRLPLGPVRSVIAAIEDAGGVVLRGNFDTTRLDAISIWVPESPPFFFMNPGMPGDRWRWSLAHEMGHALMHTQPTSDQESEADRFASEFLMPAEEIRPELARLTMPRLAELKERWKVSMQALIRRAYQLEVITQRQQRSFFMRFSQLGYRKQEPFPIPQEEPQLLQSIVEVHQTKHGYDAAELARSALMSEDEFRTAYLPAPGPSRLRLVN
jgi:Zn-dependent peptidase ImmA (M78 family)/DNA-binding XRE family transcriptional regulator